MKKWLIALLVLILFGAAPAFAKELPGEGLHPQTKDFLGMTSVVCIRGYLVIVAPGMFQQIYAPYKNPDNSYVALPAQCSIEGPKK